MLTKDFAVTFEEYLQQPVESRLKRLEETPGDLAKTIAGRSDAVLSRRPLPNKWSAKEIVCHLRDIEELVIVRFHLMLVMEEPRVFVAGVSPSNPELWGIDDLVPVPIDPDRWAEERQYLRNDAGLALQAFHRRRQEVLIFLQRLSPEQWRRGCIFPDDRRSTFVQWTAAMAAHDDQHLAQAERALIAAGA